MEFLADLETIDKGVRLLLAVNERHRQRLDRRLVDSWKVGLGVWSALAIFAGSLATGGIRTGSSPWLVGIVLLVGLVAIAGAYILFVREGATRALQDAKMARDYLDAAEGLLQEAVSQSTVPSLHRLAEALARVSDVHEERQRTWWDRVWRGAKVYFTQVLQITVTIALGLLIVALFVGNCKPTRKAVESSDRPGRSVSISDTTTRPFKSVQVDTKE